MNIEIFIFIYFLNLKYNKMNETNTTIDTNGTSFDYDI